MLKKLSAGLILLALTLVSCRNLADDDTYSSEVKKVQEEVTSELLTKQVTDEWYLGTKGLGCNEDQYELFFTPDGDIPFVEVESFLKKWFYNEDTQKTDIIVSKSGSIYRISQPSSPNNYLTIDFSSGEAFYSDFDVWNTPSTAKASCDLIVDDTLINHTQITDRKGENCSFSVNLKDYNIPLIFNNDYGFIPANTLLILTGTENEFIYNGKAVFYDNTSNYRDVKYGAAYSQKIWNKEVIEYTQEFANYSYAHLTLAMDLFYGRKSYLGVTKFDDWFTASGVKEFLSSTLMQESEAYLTKVLLQHIGDLHTYYHHVTPFWPQLYHSDTLGDILYNGFTAYPAPSPSSTRFDNNLDYLDSLFEKEIYTSYDSANKKPMNIFISAKGSDATANTIFLLFKSFDSDLGYANFKSDWKYETLGSKDVSNYMTFYRSAGGNSSLTSDSSITTLTGFIDAVKEGTDGLGISFNKPNDTILLTVVSNYIIKELNDDTESDKRPMDNVVLDLSLNTGGACDDEAFISSWFLGQSDWQVKNTITGSESSIAYFADVNFNGTYNKVEQYPDYTKLEDKYDTICNLNRFCITSLASFSCGNILPVQVYFSDRVKTFGQRSGGGTCSVKNIMMPSGTYFSTSSPYQFSTLINGSYVDIDNGAPVDTSITPMEFSDVYDRRIFCMKYLDDYKPTNP